MIKETLFEGILDLLTIKLGAIAEDEQIIEGDQGNVHYEMTREMVHAETGLTFFSLSVSGPKEERLAFIEEIAVELGAPINAEELASLPETHFAF